MTEHGLWPFEKQIRVIFRDLDALGHVNNAVYFTYMETARTTFLVERLGLKDPFSIPVIVAEASCTYLAPLYMGDLVRIQMGVSRIGRRSFDFAYLLTVGDDRPVARAKTAMVAYDYGRRTAVPIPSELLSVLEASHSPEFEA